MKKEYNDQTPLLWCALHYFVEHPYEEVYVREFSRKLTISPNTAQRFLDYLLNKKFVTESKHGNLRLFKANMGSVVFKHIRITYYLKKIQDSGIIDHCKEKEISPCILFGSVAKGENDIDSDVDIVVIGPVTQAYKKEMHYFEKKIGMELQVHAFSWAEWKKQSQNNQAFYQEVITTGIALLGDIPIAR